MMLVNLFKPLAYIGHITGTIGHSIVLYFTLLASGSLLASEIDKITHYVLHYPPYWQVNNGQISGYHYELTKRIYQQAKLNPTYVVMPYARIEAIKNKAETQAISYGSLTPKDKDVLFPVPPTLIALNSYSLKPNPPKLLKQYQGQRIAVKRGFPLGEFTEILHNDNFYTVQLNTIKASIQLLLYDRVDYVITLADPFDSTIKPFQLAENTIHKTSLIRMYGHSVAINRNNPAASELYQRINDAYKKLERDGEIIYQNNQTLLKDDYQAFIKE